MPYSDREKVKRQLGIKTSQQDVDLDEHVNGAERIMRYLIGPPGVETFTSEPTRAYRSGKIVLKNRPLVAVSSVTSASGGTVSVSSVRILDRDGGVIELLFGRFFGEYDVTYTAGRATIEANQTLAANIIVQHLWRLKNGGGGAPYPNEQDDIVPLGLGYAVPRRALELLGIEPTPIKVPGIA